MALRKLTQYQKDLRNRIAQGEEIKNMNAFENPIKSGDNVSTEDATEEVENTLGEVMKNVESIDSSSDDFFRTENLTGTATSIIGLEIEIQPEMVVMEGRYKFIVKDLAIDKNVETKYGNKDKLMIEFHISRIIEEEEITYDLKQKFNISNSSKSRFYEVYKDLIGEAPSGKVNLRILLGIKGYCDVKHIPLDNGDIFPRIVNLNAERRNTPST